MEFFDVIHQRRSVRKFLDRPVEQEKIERIVQATLRAPSARGSRSCELLIVRDAGMLDKLALAKPSGGGFLKETPLAVVICVDPARSGPWIEDAAITAIYVQLAAQAQGLSSCWVHFRDKSFSPDQSSRDYIAALLHLPANLQVECAVAIGYAGESKAPYRPEELPTSAVSYERYGNRHP
jgi:nitroreductase